MAGAWEFPSGNALEGEDIIEELQREIEEEIGLDIIDLKPKVFSISQYNTPKKDYLKCSVQINYLIKLKSKPDIKLSEEHTDYRWVKKDDNLLDEFLKEILSNL